MCVGRDSNPRPSGSKADQTLAMTPSCTRSLAMACNRVDRAATATSPRPQTAPPIWLARKGAGNQTSLDDPIKIDIFGIMEMFKAIAALGALAQESRLQVFRLLVQAGPKGRAVGEIAEALGLPGPTLSFHLAQLKGAGLARCQREGRSLIYSADYEAMSQLVAYLLENCCGGEARCAVPSEPSTGQKRRQRGASIRSSQRGRPS